MARLYLDLNKKIHKTYLGTTYDAHIRHVQEDVATTVARMNDTVANNEEITFLHAPSGHLMGVNPAFVVTVR